MKCEITVLGSNDEDTKDRNRPLEYFVKDSDQYYKVVNPHLRGCTECDPYEVSKHLWTRRKDKGWVSQSHYKQRLVIERIAKVRGTTFSDEFVVAAIVGSGIRAIVENPRKNISIQQIITTCWKLVAAGRHVHGDRYGFDAPRITQGLLYVEACLADGCGLVLGKDEAEFERFMDVAAVMGS